LSELEPTGSAEYPKVSLRRFLIVTILLVLADQLSKTLVTIFLLPGSSIPVLGNFFRITFVQNPGGVFGTRLGNQNFYTLISILAIGVTLWFFFKIKARASVLRIGLYLVLGGAVGNLIDRFRFGQVVDFLDFDFFNINLPPRDILFFRFSGFSLDRWPVFNLADGYILIGMVLVIVYLLFIQNRKLKKEISSPLRVNVTL
jgi:signal peptidase II